MLLVKFSLSSPQLFSFYQEESGLDVGSGAKDDDDLRTYSPFLLIPHFRIFSP